MTSSTRTAASASEAGEGTPGGPEPPSAREVPSYEPLLAAYHRAFERELDAMIASLPIPADGRVLEVACGDGFYARRIAGRLGRSGRLVASDLLPAYLERARGECRQGSDASRVDFVAARLEQMPFVAGSFDFVWCAQSLFSLPDPRQAVRAMARLVRPGGGVAVLETDSIHQVLLPWPAGIELAARRAELASFRDESEAPGKYYVGRHLLPLLHDAGLVGCRRRTWASDRQAPLDPDVRQFLAEYLRSLRERAAPNLDPPLRERFEALVDESSADYLLDRRNLALTCIDHLVWGFVPESAARSEQSHPTGGSED